ncbi:hypothetical protein [Pinibacter aurantiacus]|uniref:Uncharacterized protein n=1 Tax=Pinibacter aurantiacus TaxID=2851599 RepID=A0A9E2SEN2_9BACT|nr:hypothetical protein [Pinibacter aurantiacus]MBV4360354.1 hypothetical protein [Pinibacter aurantiacus]
MKFSIALTIDGDQNGKASLINDFSESMKSFLKNRDYGGCIHEWLILLTIVQPPAGYEQLFKFHNPKYTENKSRKNRFTGEVYQIFKRFDYSIQLSGDLYSRFMNGTSNESRKILADEILKSLSNFDGLSKKIEIDEIENVKKDVRLFFEEQELV